MGAPTVCRTGASSSTLFRPQQNGIQRTTEGASRARAETEERTSPIVPAELAFRDRIAARLRGFGADTLPGRVNTGRHAIFGGLGL
jgi:hypothetical protein